MLSMKEAATLALKYHGEDYDDLFHVLRVGSHNYDAHKNMSGNNSYLCHIVGYLHDAAEVNEEAMMDIAIKLEANETDYVDSEASSTILLALDVLLRDVENETYNNYIDRICEVGFLYGKIARTVKLVDIVDNMFTRRNTLTDSLHKRYSKAHSKIVDERRKRNELAEV